MVTPAIWAVSLVVLIGAAVKGDSNNQSHQVVLGVASVVFVVATLVGLWQAWAPWQIELVNR